MFIDTEPHPKTKAPAERNVVSEDSAQQRSTPPELKTYGLANYKHYVPPGLVVMVRNFV